MRVAHLITRLDLGGAQQNTLHTVSHLAPSRFEVFLACGPGGGLDAEACALAASAGRSFGLRFFPDLLREVRPARDLLALLRLARWLRALKPDVVHTHSSKAGVLGRLAASLAGVPAIVHTYHGFGFHDGQPALVRRLFILLERLCCRLTTRLIFVSEENRRQALSLGFHGAAAGILIRSGIPLTAFPAPLQDKAAKKAALGARMHKPLVLSVGNCKPQKNPEGFLAVARLCLQETPELSFLLVGDGESRPRLQARVLSLGLSGRVFFPGWRRDVPELLAAADVFLLISLWEGLPRALVEAMASGLPCVCYDADGVRDVIRDGENGFLIPRGDEESAARRVLELLRDPALRARLGGAAKASIGKEFDIDRMVREQERLYLELAGEPGSKAHVPGSPPRKSV